MKRLSKVVSVFTLSIALVFSFAFSTFAKTPKIDFIDVSHWNAQKGISLSVFQTLKRGGIKSAVVKVSDGQTYIDPAASVNLQNVKQSGMIASVYHYARFKSNAQAKNEAIWFDKKLKLIGFDQNKDGNVVVDVEDNSLTSLSAAKLTEYTNTFIKTMYQLGYYKVDLYTGSSFYNSELNPKGLLISNPWLARYSTSYLLPNFTNGKGAFQWSDSHHFTGINGHFDVSQDFFGKYTTGVYSSSTTVGKIGNVSLVDYMKSKKIDSSFTARKKLAQRYGITNYRGTSAQNLALLSKIKSGDKPAKVNISNSKLTTKAPIEHKITKVKPKKITKTVYRTLKVRCGDTLWDLAKAHKTSVATLTKVNKLRNPNSLRIGQRIKYPVTVKVTSPISPKKYITIKSGDTVSELAYKYRSTVSQIKSWNKLNSHYTVYIGEKIRVK